MSKLTKMFLTTFLLGFIMLSLTSCKKDCYSFDEKKSNKLLLECLWSSPTPDQMESYRTCRRYAYNQTFKPTTCEDESIRTK